MSTNNELIRGSIEKQNEGTASGRAAEQTEAG